MTIKELDRIYKISSPVKLGHIAGSYILYIKANVVYVCLSMCSLRFPNHVPLLLLLLLLQTLDSGFEV